MRQPFLDKQERRTGMACLCIGTAMVLAWALWPGMARLATNIAMLAIIITFWIIKLLS